MSSQIGIVYMFEESERTFSHDICGNELQRCVRHSPLQRAENHQLFRLVFMIWSFDNSLCQRL